MLTTTLREALPETGSHAAEELLDAALRGDLPRAERLLTSAPPAVWDESPALIGAAVLRLLGYGDLDGARRLLARSTDAGSSVSGAHRAASALLAWLVGGPEWERWEASAVDTVDPAVRRLVDLRRGAPDDHVRRGPSPSEPDAQLIDALAALWEPANAWRPEFASAGSTLRSVLVETIGDLDLAARRIRDARWVDAHDLLVRSAERATAAGMRVLARMADGIRSLALALDGDHESAVVLARAVLGDRVGRELPATTFAARHAILHVAVTRRDGETARIVLEARARHHLDDAVDPVGWMWDVSEAAPASASAESRHGGTLVPHVPRATAVSRSVAFSLAFLEASGSGSRTTDQLVRLIDSARGTVGNFELARALHRVAELHLAEGRLEDARRFFAEAAVEFSVAGARAWATRASASRDRVRQSRDAPRAMIVVTPLTEQEQRIVTLAAQGLSNKEIGRRLYLSPRTVGGHLYNAFPKLGVTSRAALRDALDVREAQFPRAS